MLLTLRKSGEGAKPPPRHPSRYSILSGTDRWGAQLSDATFGAAVVAAAGPCTGDNIVRLAKVAFDIAAAGKAKEVVATAIDAIALGELKAEFNARWIDLSVPQRSVLQMVAAGKPTTAADTLREYGIRTPSTAQSAVARLIDRQILVRTATGVIFDNPFFKRWVIFHAI